MRKRLLMFFIFFWVFLLFLLLGFYMYIEWQGNFHVVTQNQLYRSGQLDRDELIWYVKKYHIKSILNLRGRHPNSKWYKNEVETCKELGVVHYDYGISAVHMLSIKKMKTIIRILEGLPKPILIHCLNGADRSGLIAALWLYSIKHLSFKKAEGQLSIWFGHIPFLGNPTVAMDKSFIKFVDYTKDQGGRGRWKRF